MNSGKIRVAVIGAGSRAKQVIYPALSGIDSVEIAAVCDIDSQRRNSVMEQYSIPIGFGETTRDYRRMVEQVKPDAVLAIGQPHLMYDVWAWLLENGVPLMIEKPLGLTLHQAQSLAWLAEKNNVPTQVAFQRRYSPVATEALRLCRERGEVVHAVCRFYKCEQRPFVGARDHMMDDTVHSIDTLRHICGGEVVRVESHTKRVGVPDINFISATLHFSTGATGYLINSWSSGKRVFSVEIHAPGIFAEIEHEVGGNVYSNGSLEGQPLSAQACAASDKFEVYTGVEAAIHDFLRSINSGPPSMCRFSDALKTMHVAEVILAQALLNEG